MKSSRQPHVGAASAAILTIVGFAGAGGFAPAGFAQEPEGEFVDGEFVEGYVYVPDFMSPDELKAAIEARRDDIVIVDTAAPLIWEDEHIPGAVNYPWVHELALPVTLPRDKTLVLYCACQDHEDSADMAQKLSLAGFLKVKVLEGGWFDWLDLGYPTISKAEEEASHERG
jgi:rhodanese-related sulfurtransferase